MSPMASLDRHDRRGPEDAPSASLPRLTCGAEAPAPPAATSARSNDQLRETPGLKSRRLLRAPDGSYTALVEHESATSFAAMHETEGVSVSMIQAGLGSILNDNPQATTYEVVVDFSTAETCCGDGHGTATHEGTPHAQVSGGCCRDA